VGVGVALIVDVDAGVGVGVGVRAEVGGACEKCVISSVKSPVRATIKLPSAVKIPGSVDQKDGFSLGGSEFIRLTRIRRRFAFKDELSSIYHGVQPGKARRGNKGHRPVS